MRAARRGLKKYVKFNLYNEIYNPVGELLNNPVPAYAFFEEDYTGEAWCVKCKDKKEFTGKIKVSNSGRRMAYGKCPKCGTKVNRILAKK